MAIYVVKLTRVEGYHGETVYCGVTASCEDNAVHFAILDALPEDGEPRELENGFYTNDECGLTAVRVQRVTKVDRDQWEMFSRCTGVTLNGSV